MDCSLDVDGYIFDLDGTIYIGEEAIEGAVELLGAMERAGVPRLFVTNTTSLSVDDIVGRLSAIGVDAGPDDVLTPVTILTGELERRGVERIAIEYSPALESSFPGFELSDDPQVIILADSGSGLDYARVNRVLRAGLEGTEIVALIRNKYYRRAGGMSADLGFYVAGFEYVLGRKITTFGKPSKAVFDAALERLGIDEPGRVAMVGDDIEFDVLGAMEHGLKGVLVRTGKYLGGVEERFTRRPSLVIDSVAELMRLFR